MNQKSTHANPSKNRTPRHRSREFALQGLYQWLISNEDSGVIDAHIRQAHGFDKADAEHFNTVLHGVIEHAALLIGAYELRHHIEIPYKVVINEAVELTKSFGGIDGHKYVNGVLDKLAARLRTLETEASRNG
jgi:N utilization substance protein B